MAKGGARQLNKTARVVLAVHHAFFKKIISCFRTRFLKYKDIYACYRDVIHA